MIAISRPSTPQFCLRFWGANARQAWNALNGVADDREEETDQTFCLWFYERSRRDACWRKACSFQCVVTSCYRGPDVRKKTVAKMTLRHAGKEYRVEYDFGYGYPAHTAEYYLEDGNGSCDCNRSRYIQEQCDADFPELDCGDAIELVGLEIDGGETEWDKA